MVTLFKPRGIPLKIKLQKYLQSRLDLPDDVKNYYNHQLKGFEGEQKFDELIKDVNGHAMIINDLLYEKNNSEFQIDSMIISKSAIHLYDVKNMEGEYYISSGKWYTCHSNKEVKNPFAQLDRCEQLFKQLLQSLGIHLPVKTNLIFVHQNFTLKQASKDLPIIYPTQFDSFKKKLEWQLSEKLNQRHLNYAELLMSARKEEDQYKNLVSYSFEEMHKGVTCGGCGAFMFLEKRKLKCSVCGCLEKVDDGVLRCVEEYSHLFPGRKITTKDIFEWLGGEVPVKALCRILSANYERVGKSVSTHYIAKQQDREKAYQKKS